MTSKAKELIQAAKVRLAFKQPYLTAGIYAMRMTPSGAVPTMGVDTRWNCYYNPNTVEKWSVEVVSTVLAHELWHLLRGHSKRTPVLSPTGEDMPRETIHEMWNIATDCEINDGLDQVGKLPEGCVYPKTIGMEDGLLAEEYYKKVTKEINDKFMANHGGSCADGIHREWETVPDSNVSDLEGELIRKQTAKKILEENKHRGNMPGGMVRWADDVMRPSLVPWNKELSSIIRGHLASLTGLGDVTYSRRHRRQEFYGNIIRPSPYRLIPTIAVVVDTSGSVSDDMLGQALAEIQGVLKANDGLGVSVLSCDAEAGVAQRVFSKKAVQFTGGGGTDMRVGVDAAMKLKPHVCILVTDGYTPYHETAPNQTCKFVTLVLGEGGAVPSYGKVVRYVEKGHK